MLPVKINTICCGLKEDNICTVSSNRYWPTAKPWWDFIDIWQTATCPIQVTVFSLLCPFTSLWGTFNVQIRCGWRIEWWRNTLKCWQTCEMCSVRILRFTGKYVWSVRRKNAEPRFRLLLRPPPLTKHILLQTQIPVMRRILHRCYRCFSHSETVCIHAGVVPPLCSPTKVSGWQNLIKSLWLRRR